MSGENFWALYRRYIDAKAALEQAEDDLNAFYERDLSAGYLASESPAESP